MLALFPTVRIVTEALSDVAYATLSGVLLNRLWLGKVELCNHRLRICMWASSTILLVNLPLQFLFLSASMTGDSSWTDAWRWLPYVAATHAGRTMVLSFCLVPCFLLFSFFRASLEKMRNVIIGLGIDAGFIASRALWGHAAADGDFTLREGMQFLHLSSIGIWCGGVLVAGLVTLPMLASRDEENEVEQFGRRLSRTVTLAFAIVVLSGVYNSWKGLGGSVRLLSHSSWGRMLLLKLSFVLIALGHGTRVRFLLKARDRWTHNQTTSMQRWVCAEGLFMLLVLIFSGWLANMPPADM